MESPKKDGTRQVEEVILGKKFPSEKFVTIRSAADVEEVAKLHEKHAHADAIPIEAYLSIRGHNEHTMQAMLLAHTKVRRATMEAFDEIFKSFFDSTPVEDEEESEPETAAPLAYRFVGDYPKTAAPKKEV